MQIKVCIGESCHLQGAEEVVLSLKENISKVNDGVGRGQTIRLMGCFCMNACNENGVSVLVNTAKYTVHPDNANVFFKNHVSPKE
ncbi:MAG: NAD(P)H-dependent oxidoreductase subunit E [Deltaproteobacteria bacterium]|nr:NAD(P)H-dependent oxidoreductase subunit E [Deltaproteobacteria bacterium]MBN2671544.1 NAD(P)H-dependent oxidoreductase subunit E [Deltaproteobacteria bacterium]